MKINNILIMLLLATTAYAKPVPLSEVEFQANRFPSNLQRIQLGTMVTKNKVQVLRGVFDTSVLGGASVTSSGGVKNIQLVGTDGTPAVLPANSMVLRTWVDPLTAPTSPAPWNNPETTVGFSVVTAGDVFPATRIGNFIVGSFYQGVSIIGTGKKTSVDAILNANVGKSVLNAGKFNVMVEYYLSN